VEEGNKKGAADNRNTQRKIMGYSRNVSLASNFLKDGEECPRRMLHMKGGTFGRLAKDSTGGGSNGSFARSSKKEERHQRKWL